MRRPKYWLLLILLVGAGAWAIAWWRYPSDRTPEGAYLRVMSAVNRGKPEDFFAYLETEAQHAAFTIGDYRRRSHQLVVSSYPAADQTRQIERLGSPARLSDGPQVFAHYALARGWLDQLRKDLSGIASVEIQGERATVHTARGTRYPFRRRDNGIWGLTLFTPTLIDEANRAARDLELIDSAAADYRGTGAPANP